MPKSRKFRKKIIQGVIVVLLISVIMSWSTSNPARTNFLQDMVARTLYPVQYAVNTISRWTVSTWEFATDVRDVFLENRELKELVDQYTGIELELIETREENSRLKDLLGFKDDVEFDVLPAQVIGRNPSTWFSTLVLDKGHNDGITMDMPVVTNQGLVGKTIEVYPSHSKIQLAISLDSGVSAMIQRTRDTGVLLGVANPTGYAKITRLNQHAEIDVGDVVISSPLTGIYPKGLVIGRVVEIYDDQVAMERSALVKPEVDFDRLEEVLIVLNYSDPQQEVDADDSEDEVQQPEGEE